MEYCLFLSPNSLSCKGDCEQLFADKVKIVAESLCGSGSDTKLFHNGSRYIHVQLLCDNFVCK